MWVLDFNPWKSPFFRGPEAKIGSCCPNRPGDMGVIVVGLVRMKFPPLILNFIPGSIEFANRAQFYRLRAKPT
jgi:hypothetical protein